MSQQNVDVVRRVFEAFNRRDLDSAMRDADPDVEVDWSRSVGVEAGTYRGLAAARDFWNTLLDGFERIVVVPEEFIEHGDCVVVPNRARVQGRDGIEAEARSPTVVLSSRAHRRVADVPDEG